MSPLAGKIALVTGGQQGIGRAAVLALARAGADVVINYLNRPDAASRLLSEVEAQGVRAAMVQADVAEEGAVAALFGEARRFGGVDVLVNNAGIFPRASFLEMSLDDWKRVIGVNLTGTFLCTRAAARDMVERERGGSIVNLASVAAFRGSPRGVHYVASKGGIIGLTRASAVELAPHRIRVNAIAPGLTDTAQPRDGMSEEEIAAKSAEIPLGGITLPEDIAETIVFLAGESARQITGQTVSVNGGQFLY